MDNTLRLIAYRIRSAPVYAADPQEWQARVTRGLRVIAQLHAPRPQPASNVRVLRVKGK